MTRPYSIASAPGTPDRVSLLLNFVPNGPGSTYLLLNEGETTTFSGPAGNFYLRDDPGRELLFVATGTGIAPIRSMLLANAERPQPKYDTLFWGLQKPARSLLRGKNWRACQTCARKLGGHHRVAARSRLDGLSGRVTSLVEQDVHDVKRLAVYLCGNRGMIKEVTR